MPDHSTFQEQAYRFRQRDLLRRVFESVLGRCIEARLVGGEGFTVNASLLKADALRPGCALDRGARRPGLLRLLDELCGRRRERGHPSVSRRPRRSGGGLRLIPRISGSRPLPANIFQQALSCEASCFLKSMIFVVLIFLENLDPIDGAADGARLIQESHAAEVILTMLVNFLSRVAGAL